MSTASRIDTTCIITATALAAGGAFGLLPDSAIIARIAEGADLAAGGFAARHAVHHLLHGRKHSQTTNARVSIATDGRGRVTWSR